MIVVDTNVISELMASTTSGIVQRWINFQKWDELYTTAICEAELLFGIERMPKGKRRDEMEATASRVLVKVFPARILPFDSGAARAFAVLAGERRRAGKPMSLEDSQIAAIARANNAALATRNVAHFEGCGITVINPWTA